MKPVVFISHIHEEESVAKWLKDSISELLLGGIEFFVSSDGTGIIGGDRWLNKIEDSLKRASVVLALCSARSVLRPWINFEAGGAWISGKRVVPICHSGMEITGLPEPLKSLHAYKLDQDFQDLVGLLASEAGLNKPQFDPAKFMNSLPVITREAEPEGASSFEPIFQSEQYCESFGVFWDKDYKMRCLNCRKPLKNSSMGPSVFFCSDPKCNSKHILRNDDGVELIRKAAVSFLMKNRSEKE